MFELGLGKNKMEAANDSAGGGSHENEAEQIIEGVVEKIIDKNFSVIDALRQRMKEERLSKEDTIKLAISNLKFVVDKETGGKYSEDLIAKGIAKKVESYFDISF